MPESSETAAEGCAKLGIGLSRTTVQLTTLRGTTLDDTAFLALPSNRRASDTTKAVCRSGLPSSPTGGCWARAKPARAARLVHQARRDGRTRGGGKTAGVHLPPRDDVYDTLAVLDVQRCRPFSTGSRASSSVKTARSRVLEPPASNGVDVVNLESDECYQLMQSFVAEHPDVWFEDIRGGVVESGQRRRRASTELPRHRRCSPSPALMPHEHAPVGDVLKSTAGASSRSAD